MSTVEILCIALLAFSAFCALVQAVKEVLVARATPPACPCRDLHSLTLTAGATYELPPGMKVSAATVADPRIVGIHERDIRTTLSGEGVEDLARAFKRAAGEVH